MPPSRKTPVVFWLRRGVQLIDVAGPAEVFSTATALCRHRGETGGYDIAYAADKRGPITTSAGLAVHAGHSARMIDRRDRRAGATLIVPGVLSDAETPPNAALLRRIASWPGRLASICTGAWRLAQAGRLDGRRATSHWMVADAMRAEFPSVELDADALFVEDNGVWTSAGASAGIDLALAMVERDLGRRHALTVARLLVLYMKRPGGQSQFSTALRSQHGKGDRFEALLEWMRANPRQDQHVEALAKRVGMSPRHFARVFRQVLGVTPAKRVNEIRLEHAIRLLTDERDVGLGEIADRCGLGSAESLRRLLVRSRGVPPGAYRERF